MTRIVNFTRFALYHPGVHADINGESKAYHCLFELFTPEIQDNLVVMINEYATLKKNENLPARENS